MVENLYYFVRLHGLGKGQTDKKIILHLVLYFIHCSLMLKTIHPPQPWTAFPQPHVLLQRPGTPQSPVAFEVFEVSVGEAGVFETKVPLRHLSAKSPSPPLETKGCFQSVMVFSLSVKEAPSWATDVTRTRVQGDTGWQPSYRSWFVRIWAAHRFLNFHTSSLPHVPISAREVVHHHAQSLQFTRCLQMPYSCCKNLR